MSLCNVKSLCVATSFNSAINTCTFYSEVGAAYAKSHVNVAIRLAETDSTTLEKGSVATATIYSTKIMTVTSTEDHSVTHNVSTELVIIGTTTYKRDKATTISGRPVACDGCESYTSEAVIYTTKMTSGSVQLVSSQIQVVTVPIPTLTDF